MGRRARTLTLVLPLIGFGIAAGQGFKFNQWTAWYWAAAALVVAYAIVAPKPRASTIPGGDSARRIAWQRVPFTMLFTLAVISVLIYLSGDKSARNAVTAGGAQRFYPGLVAAPLDDDLQKTLQEMQSMPQPPIRIEIRGFGLVARANDEPMQEVSPGTGDSTTKLSFTTHILNLSPQHRVSLMFRTFEIRPGFKTFGGIELDGIRRNLGPEEDTEGTVRIPIDYSEYSTLTTRQHLKLLEIFDAVSGRTSIVTVPTTVIRKNE